MPIPLNFSSNNTVLKGRIHSFESCGTLDGPGIRFVVFFQGCMMRCLYCHNRDTWEINGGQSMSVEELMREVITYKNYMKSSGGGVTASGGEALLQTEFVRDWFKACHQADIHTCLDTNGYVQHYTPALDELLEHTDLVMLDLKQLDNTIHKKLIGVSNRDSLKFAQYLNEKKIPTWIRYVVVPGWSDDEHSVRLLGEFIQPLKNIEKVELLPYHSLGVHKWQTLGKEYQLHGIPSPDAESMRYIQSVLEEYGHRVTY